MTIFMMRLVIGICLLLASTYASPSNGKQFEVQSPDGKLSAQIVVDEKLAYCIC